MPQIEVPVHLLGQKNHRPQLVPVPVAARHHTPASHQEHGPANLASFVHDQPNDAGHPVRVLETSGGFTRLEEAALRIYCADVSAGHIDLSPKAIVHIARSLLEACALSPGGPLDERCTA